jgi:hypothetical protein
LIRYLAYEADAAGAVVAAGESEVFISAVSVERLPTLSDYGGAVAL